MASTFTRFLDHTQRRTTVGRTPLDEWSARRRDLYLTTHNTHNTQHTPLTTHNTYNRRTSGPPVGFEPTISAGERPQTYTLDHATTWTGKTVDIHVCTRVSGVEMTLVLLRGMFWLRDTLWEKKHLENNAPIEWWFVDLFTDEGVESRPSSLYTTSHHFTTSPMH